MRKTLLAIILLAPVCGFSQQYSITWFKIAGGGGTSTGTNAGGVFSLSGTIGQHDASTALTGGGYSLTGGFWSIYAVQTTGAPLLSIQTTNGMVMVSWPSPSTGFNLQVSTNLSGTNWVTPSQTVSSNALIKYILANPAAGTAYYRLESP